MQDLHGWQGAACCPLPPPSSAAPREAPRPAPRHVREQQRYQTSGQQEKPEHPQRRQRGDGATPVPEERRALPGEERATRPTCTRGDSRRARPELPSPADRRARTISMHTGTRRSQTRFSPLPRGVAAPAGRAPSPAPLAPEDRAVSAAAHEGQPRRRPLPGEPRRAGL